MFGMGTRFLVFMLDLDYTWAVQLYFLFLLIAIFLGMRDHFAQNRELVFGRLFKVGAQIGAIFTLLSAMFTYTFYRFIDTEFFTFMIQSRLAAVKETGATAEELLKYESNLGMVFNPSTQSLATLIGFMFLTLTYAMLVALVLTEVPLLRKTPK